MLEALEDRRLLNASPIARNDLAYYTPVDQPLVVDSTSSLLLNDFDPDGGTLSASVVTNPQNGTLTDFDPTSGTFTYVPNAGFSGIDRFTYQLSDGQASSSVATVQIAVGGPFGGKLNDEEFSPAEADRSATGVLLASGALTREELLTPSVKLVYNSLTIPKALVPLETFLVPDAAVPDEIRRGWFSMAWPVTNTRSIPARSSRATRCASCFRPTLRHFPRVAIRTRLSYRRVTARSFKHAATMAMWRW
ncbi:MAG: hypothetical protein KatS3mg110_1929 [Pirellulaceae bacterium]|nr:MAG: hypothetical protein KatS3mg110_1929 [Pirellulaceae bacterium]